MAMQRSRSMPVVNPFWSSKTQEALRVAASRPVDLPRVPTEDELEEQVEPIESGMGSGAVKREWSRPRVNTTDPGDGPVSEEKFAKAGAALQTPSSWSRPDVSGMGQRTEGPLPASAGGASATERLGDGQSRLEQDLGQLMFEQLQEENHLLRMQLEAVKRKHESGSSGDGSTPTSWSCVSKRDGQPRPPPPKSPRLHEGAQHGGGQHRFTPGGTRIPDGPPPDDGENIVKPEFVLPAWPPSLEGYGNCEREERKSGGKLGDGRKPPWMQAANQLVMSPRQARMAWLEREVWAML